VQKISKVFKKLAMHQIAKICNYFEYAKLFIHRNYCNTLNFPNFQINVKVLKLFKFASYRERKKIFKCTIIVKALNQSSLPIIVVA
jgi:hypothetical protein